MTAAGKWQVRPAVFQNRCYISLKLPAFPFSRRPPGRQIGDVDTKAGELFVVTNHGQRDLLFTPRTTNQCEHDGFTRRLNSQFFATLRAGINRSLLNRNRKPSPLHRIGNLLDAFFCNHSQIKPHLVPLECFSRRAEREPEPFAGTRCTRSGLRFRLVTRRPAVPIQGQDQTHRVLPTSLPEVVDCGGSESSMRLGPRPRRVRRTVLRKPRSEPKVSATAEGS